MAGPDNEQRLNQVAEGAKPNPHEQQFASVPITLLDGWKLVRDGYKGRLQGYEQRSPTGESELKEAVATKIVEEAIELADAVRNGNRTLVIAEGADLRDILVTTLDLAGVTRAQVRQRREKKRARLGRFNKGLLQREVKPEAPQA